MACVCAASLTQACGNGDSAAASEAGATGGTSGSGGSSLEGGSSAGGASGSSSGGTGGSGGSGGGNNGGGGGGSAGGAGDAGTGGSPGSCVDIRVTGAILPADAANPWRTDAGPPIGLTLDRDHVWRDSLGVHVAWNAAHVDGTAELVVSSFDPATGGTIDNRLFRTGGRKGFWAAGAGPNDSAGLAVHLAAGDGGFQDGLIILSPNDPTPEKLFVLPAWPAPVSSVASVGWDGEAFAVHAFGTDNTQYVTRIKADGTVLLPPKAFGVAAGYPAEAHYATDSVSGLSVAITGTDRLPWLTGHLRDGTPTPDSTKPLSVVLAPQGSPDAGVFGGQLHSAVCAVQNGAAVAWSHDSGGTGLRMTTFIQSIGVTLAASADAIPVSGNPLSGTQPTDYDSVDWLTMQPIAGGFWLAGVPGPGNPSLDEYVVSGTALASRRAIVTFSDRARKMGIGFDARHVESAKFGAELWVAYQDNTARSGPAPFRVVLAKERCTYPSMIDVELGSP